MSVRDQKLRIAHIEDCTSIYGFDNTFTIWVQGCTLNCKGCWNKSLHPKEGGVEMTVGEIVDRLVEVDNKIGIRTVTILGGEPLQQANIFNLLSEIVEQGKYAIILYTGYDREEIEEMGFGKHIYLADILISGRYVEELRDIRTNSWIGSTNQKIELLNDTFITKEEFDNRVNGTQIEIVLQKDGGKRILGFPDEINKIIK